MLKDPILLATFVVGTLTSVCDPVPERGGQRGTLRPGLCFVLQVELDQLGKWKTKSHPNQQSYAGKSRNVDAVVQV